MSSNKAKLININGDTTDSFYRYKFYELVSITKKGGLTHLMNINKIAQQLHRSTEKNPGEFLLTYMGKSLGVGTIIRTNGEMLLRGKIKNFELQKIIFKFVKDFVFCPTCQDASTSLQVKGKKQNKLFINCRACSAPESQIHNPYLSSNMIKLMIKKNTPEALQKEQKKTNKQTKLEPIKELNESSDDDWSDSEDFSEEAVKARMKALGVEDEGEKISNIGKC